MKGNKIIATLVVLAMVLSTLVVLNKLNINVVEEASAVTPGVNAWGNATTDLEYGVSYSSVRINTERWNETGILYLYYPIYRSGGTGGNANEFTWAGPFVVGISSAKLTRIVGDKNLTLDTGGLPITFNRSGMWIFDNNAHHQGDDNTTYAGYLWVNTSTKYSIESVSDINYGATGSVTITVNTANDTGCMIAIMAPDNSTVYHKWRATGVTEAIEIEGNFTLAGDYTVKAYRDLDAQNSTYFYPDENNDNFSMYYGSDYSSTFPAHPATNGDIYSYADMGPWDPPEKNATEITFTVNSGEPIITLTNTSIYWGFETRIDVNITDSQGNGIMPYATAGAHQVIKLKKGSTYYHDAIINNTHITEGQREGNYSIYIPRWFATQGRGWTNLTDWISSGGTVKGNSTNGTWKVVFGYDAPTADDNYEWNASASFSVKSANPPVQLVIVNDGSGTATDKKVNVPGYVSGANQAATIDIEFDIFGRSINNEFRNAYYGDDPDEEDGVLDNITIEGDILYPIDATTLVHGTHGRWTATVTPTKPGGTITIAIDWPGDENGTATETIEIVNGTFVTSAVESFTVGADYNLTVTVKDMDGAPVKNAYVVLLWQDQSTRCNLTNGTNKAGNGLNGEYTFWIPPHKKDATTPDTAPQNLTVAVRWYGDFWGYTKVIMERNHNMMVNVTPTTAYAGDAIEYDIMVNLVGGGLPDDTDLTVALYNATGELVTGDDAWSKTEDYSITNEEIILTGGTYHIYAYNATHDSKGNNATLIVTNYTVTSSPSILAWVIDEAVNMTFQLTPAGNGTLTLYNMSSIPEASDQGQSTQIAIENGVGTLDEVNAVTLGNVTFSFIPDGGADRCADGLLRVTTATATPSPATIYNGEPTLVTITVTHPATGTPLEDVRVGLDHGIPLNESILAKLPTDQFTGADGKVEFSITADASGNVTIYIENETDPDNEFVIVAAARKQMTISNDPSVDETKTFTIEAKSNGVLITGTVTFTFNGQTWPTTTGVATITAPSVTTSLTYPITATAEGYTSVSGTIMVLNVPKLIVAISGDVKAGQTFTLTVADDAGNAVIGATVTFEGKTYTTGAGGTVTMTAPTTEGSYPVSATFPGFGSVSSTVTVLKGGGIPGFELLTLVAAIGVAFLLLRRRRN
jgi:hypothetical protein